MKGKCRAFEMKLKDLTCEEELISFITAYRFTGKPFCGEYDHATFRLSRNTPWRGTKSILITGTFQKKDNGFTEVEYDVGPGKFYGAIMPFFFAAMLILLNVVLFTNMKKFSASVFMTLNGFLLAGFLFQKIILHFTKMMVEERFTTEFEIEKIA